VASEGPEREALTLWCYATSAKIHDGQVTDSTIHAMSFNEPIGGFIVGKVNILPIGGHIRRRT
jgi:hypothetical protein